MYACRPKKSLTIALLVAFIATTAACDILDDEEVVEQEEDAVAEDEEGDDEAGDDEESAEEDEEDEDEDEQEEEVAIELDSSEDLDGCYVLTEDYLESGATLEGCLHVTEDLVVDVDVDIAPGTTLSFGVGNRLELNGSDGGQPAFTALGTADDPITFTTDQDEGYPGAWSGIILRHTASDHHRVEHAVIEYGGQNYRINPRPNQKGGLVLWGEGQLELSHSAFRHNEHAGLSVYSEDSVLDLSESEFVGQEGHPIRVRPNQVPSLGEGLSFEDNAIEAVYVSPDRSRDHRDFTIDGTWPALDIPYYGGEMDIEAALTLAPGVAVHMASGAEWTVRDGGSLNAVATEDEPIVFRGQTPAPGYWNGLHYNASWSDDNKLHHVELHHAGNTASLRANHLTSLDIDHVLVADAPDDAIIVDTARSPDHHAQLTGCDNLRFENIGGEELANGACD